jgi:hypothetical protein
MLSLTFRLALILLVAVSSRLYGEEVVNGSVSLCDIATDQRRFSGSVVRIHATLAFGKHGPTLYDAACPTAAVGGYVWANYACFDLGRSEGADDLMDLASEVSQRSVKQGRTHSMEVVVRGLLHVVRPSGRTLVRDGRAWGTGFCAGNTAPFVLTLRRVESLTIRKAE